MTKEECTIIVNLMTPGAGVLVLGRGHISRIVKNALFLVFSTLVHDSDKLSHSNDDHGRLYQTYKPPGQGSCSRSSPYKHIVKIHYFFKNLHLDQTNLRV